MILLASDGDARHRGLPTFREYWYASSTMFLNNSFEAVFWAIQTNTDEELKFHCHAMWSEADTLSGTATLSFIPCVLKYKWWFFNQKWWFFNTKWWFFNTKWWFFNTKWWFFNQKWWFFNKQWWFFNQKWYSSIKNDDSSIKNDDSSIKWWFFNKMMILR